jgi:hypothetical protein
LLLANICLRLSSSAHSPLTTGFELRHPRPEAGETAEYSPFWARKAATGGDFWGAILGFFGQLQGLFREPSAFFLGFLVNYRKFLGALARSIAPTATFSPQNKRKKRTNQKKTSISMHAVAYFNGNKDTFNSVFDIFCTVQVCLLNKTFSMEQFLWIRSSV